MKNNEYAFNEIADLYEYIQDAEYIEREYILEKLEQLQNFVKNYL